MANNVAGSIVDFLKSRGLKPQSGEKFPFYETRGQLYGSSDLGASLGDFRGTVEQNTALLQSLRGAEKSTGITITSENLFDVATVARGGGTPQPSVLQQTPMETTEGTTGTETQQTPTQQPIQQSTQQPAQQLPQQTSPAINAQNLLPQIPGAGDVASQALEQVTKGQIGLNPKDGTLFKKVTPYQAPYLNTPKSF